MTASHMAQYRHYRALLIFYSVGLVRTKPFPSLSQKHTKK